MKKGLTHHWEGKWADRWGVWHWRAFPGWEGGYTRVVRTEYAHSDAENFDGESACIVEGLNTPGGIVQTVRTDVYTYTEAEGIGWW